jgi:hypothetical protein
VVGAWFSAFALTQLVECPIYVRALRGHERPWLWAFGASALSHPLIFLVLPSLWSGDWLSYVVMAEGIAVAIETLWLSWLGVARPLRWALAANFASLGISLATRALFDWP